MRTAVLVTGLCLLLAGAARARSSATFTYSLEDVYHTAVRFLRIDRGCSIVDRDAQSAYIVFECKDDKRMKRGALELYRKAGSVRVQLTLSDDPSYLEARWLELLGRKLREERGSESPPQGPSRPDPEGRPSQGGAREKRDQPEQGGPPP